jgi:dipeptidyl aminopeptidase/acylaminoacyl peptidase
VSPPGVVVRTRVHEYGGGAATVSHGLLVTSELSDGRLSVVALDHPGPPLDLTPLPAGEAVTLRYADGRRTGSGRWLVAVEEEVAPTGTRHRLVAVAMDGSGTVTPLVEGPDFVAAPRISPDGAWLAWISWDHPSMPWDLSVLWLARLEESADTLRISGARRVTGGTTSAVGQPRWRRDGSLVFADDRSGWWLLYRTDPEPAGVGPVALEVREAEFHAPDWVLGQSTVAELSDGTLLCRMHQGGTDRLVRLGPGTMTEVVQPCVTIAGVVVADGDRACVLGSTPSEAHAVFEVSLDGTADPIRLSAATTTVGTADIAVSRPFVAATAGGPVPGLFFAPTNAFAVGPDGAAPPLVVFCHGGPTSAAEAGFDPVVQFFTSRGLAVAAVDYRGSSGYGRAYRGKLAGLWGEADVDDCVGYAVALAEQGWVDGRRMAIRGTSAGGLTALGALIRSDRFAGAASWYGVTDLETLAADTHAFESRYIDGLVGPWPESADVYRERSPLRHADRVSGQVLLLQGSEDPVVPAPQSEQFAAALADHGVPCRLILFEGESHGFRRAATIEAALTAELTFYRTLFADGTSEPTDGGRSSHRG